MHVPRQLFVPIALFILVAAGFGLIRERAEATHFTNWLEIRSPFAGYWDKFGIAPPATHHTPWNGDWATDVYAAPGTNGGFRVANSDGGTAYGTIASPGTMSSCAGSTWAGYAYRITVSDASGPRGWYLAAHINGVAPGGGQYLLSAGQTLYSGAGLGQTAAWAYSSCWQVQNLNGVHWHVEFEQPSHWSCWVPWSAGASLQVTSMLGAIGSNATTKSSCWP